MMLNGRKLFLFLAGVGTIFSCSEVSSGRDGGRSPARNAGRKRSAAHVSRSPSPVKKNRNGVAPRQQKDIIKATVRDAVKEVSAALLQKKDAKGVPEQKVVVPNVPTPKKTGTDAGGAAPKLVPPAFQTPQTIVAQKSEAEVSGGDHKKALDQKDTVVVASAKIDPAKKKSIKVTKKKVEAEKKLVSKDNTSKEKGNAKADQGKIEQNEKKRGVTKKKVSEAPQVEQSWYEVLQGVWEHASFSSLWKAAAPLMVSYGGSSFPTIWRFAAPLMANYCANRVLQDTRGGENFFNFLQLGAFMGIQALPSVLSMMSPHKEVIHPAIAAPAAPSSFLPYFAFPILNLLGIFSSDPSAIRHAMGLCYALAYLPDGGIRAKLADTRIGQWVVGKVRGMKEFVDRNWGPAASAIVKVNEYFGNSLLPFIDASYRFYAFSGVASLLNSLPLVGSTTAITSGSTPEVNSTPASTPEVNVYSRTLSGLSLLQYAQTVMPLFQKSPATAILPFMLANGGPDFGSSFATLLESGRMLYNKTSGLYLRTPPFPAMLVSSMVLLLNYLCPRKNLSEVLSITKISHPLFQIKDACEKLILPKQDLMLHEKSARLHLESTLLSGAAFGLDFLMQGGFQSAIMKGVAAGLWGYGLDYFGQLSGATPLFTSLFSSLLFSEKTERSLLFSAIVQAGLWKFSQPWKTVHEEWNKSIHEYLKTLRSTRTNSNSVAIGSVEDAVERARIVLQKKNDLLVERNIVLKALQMASKEYAKDPLAKKPILDNGDFVRRLQTIKDLLPYSVKTHEKISSSDVELYDMSRNIEDTFVSHEAKLDEALKKQAKIIRDEITASFALNVNSEGLNTKFNTCSNAFSAFFGKYYTAFENHVAAETLSNWLGMGAPQGQDNKWNQYQTCVKILARDMDVSSFLSSTANGFREKISKLYNSNPYNNRPYKHDDRDADALSALRGISTSQERINGIIDILGSAVRRHTVDMKTGKWSTEAFNQDFRRCLSPMKNISSISSLFSVPGDMINQPISQYTVGNDVLETRIPSEKRRLTNFFLYQRRIPPAPGIPAAPADLPPAVILPAVRKTIVYVASLLGKQDHNIVDGFQDLMTKVASRFALRKGLHEKIKYALYKEGMVLDDTVSELLKAIRGDEIKPFHEVEKVLKEYEKFSMNRCVLNWIQANMNSNQDEIDLRNVCVEYLNGEWETKKREMKDAATLYFQALRDADEAVKKELEMAVFLKRKRELFEKLESA